MKDADADTDGEMDGDTDDETDSDAGVGTPPDAVTETLAEAAADVETDGETDGETDSDEAPPETVPDASKVRLQFGTYVVEDEADSFGGAGDGTVVEVCKCVCMVDEVVRWVHSFYTKKNTVAILLNLSN